jgi:LPXTG-site transpeptidase (sortase) family protein
MRAALRISGSVLIVLSVLGLIMLGVATFAPEDDQPISADTPIGNVSLPAWSARGTAPRASSARTRASAAIGDHVSEPPEAGRPITRIQIPSIDLTADVVPADLVPLDGGLTWQVPPFKVGHAGTTVGAGQPGNAILLGHVTSVRSGNVFQNLDRVSLGDTVQVLGDADAFDYRVVSISRVLRSDASVLQPTERPSVSLITCTGLWLPTIWDYTERLVVHAELSHL